MFNGYDCFGGAGTLYLVIKSDLMGTLVSTLKNLLIDGFLHFVEKLI